MPLIPWWIKYPNVNDEVLNLDWLLKKMQENDIKIDNFINLNTIKYADPILWDITSQYEANTVVVDPQTGDAYISVQPVPVGVILSNTDYWTKIYNYADAITTLQKQIAAADEGLSPTATAIRNYGDLVWLNGKLYIVISPMNIGDAYAPGSNCVATTIETVLRNLDTNITTGLNTLRTQIAAADEGSSPTATSSRSIGDLVWLNGVLYVVTSPMNAGDTYVPGTNVVHTTIETILGNMQSEIDVLNAEVFPTYKSIVTVGAHGCDFTTINAAITYARNFCTPTDRVAIVVNGGTYNEEITLPMNPGIDFFGIGMPRVWYNSTYPNAPLFSTGNFTVQGFFFMMPGSGSSYAFHYEAQNDLTVTDTSAYIRDCVFYSSGNACCGIGMGDGHSLRFYNCSFYHGNGGSGIYAHNTPQGSNTLESLELYSCDFHTGENPIYIENARAIGGGGTPSYMKITVANCITDATNFKIGYKYDNNTFYRYVPASGEIYLDAHSVNNANLNGVTAGKASIQYTTYVAIPYNGDGAGNKYFSVTVDSIDLSQYDVTLNSMMIHGGNYTSSTHFLNTSANSINFYINDAGVAGVSGLVTFTLSTK